MTMTTPTAATDARTYACDRLECSAPARWKVTSTWGAQKVRKMELLCDEHEQVAHEYPARNEGCQAVYREPVR